MRRTQQDNQDSHRKISRRALMLGGAMSAMIAALGARMRYLQIDQAEEFKLLAEENRVAIRLIPPTRGQIHDRNGKLIAGNEQNYRVVITREDAGDIDLIMGRLANIIPMTREEIEDVVADSRRNSPFVPVQVRDRLSWEEFSKIGVNAPALPGVAPDVGLSRIYPRDIDFAHVVGYVGPVSERDLASMENPDPVLRLPKFQIGKIGVERFMETELRGQAGNKRIEVNAVGRVMRELERSEGTPGADLRLTIDADLQNFTQARLGLESAAVVLMDVTNGDIMACVSSPSFDPNLFVRGISHKDYSLLVENDHRPLANKTVAGAYPPGSTFKMITALAAIEAGLVGENYRVYCPGYLEFGGRRFHCHSRGGHGTLNVVQALEKSCDVYFYDIAQKIGIDKMSEMGRRFGLGMRHDLPMSAISEGLMPTKAWKQERHGQDWRVGDTINASIGQGYVLATPLQLAVMTARLASGKAVKPRLVKSIGGQETPIEEAEPLGLSPSGLNLMRRGMYDVINAEGGTGKSVRVVDPAMILAGKSGTAQVRNITAAERARGVVSNDQLPWHRRDHALFVAYGPYDNPRYAAAVVVEHGSAGSSVAGPIARDVILAALSGGLPPLSAYPAAQRGRIETMLNELQLRDPETGAAPAAQKV